MQGAGCKSSLFETSSDHRHLIDGGDFHRLAILPSVGTRVQRRKTPGVSELVGRPLITGSAGT